MEEAYESQRREIISTSLVSQHLNKEHLIAFICMLTTNMYKHIHIWSIPQKGANSDFFSFMGITLLNFVSSGNFWYQIIRGFQGYLAYPNFPHFIPIVKMPEAKNCIFGAFFTQKYNLFHL